MLFLKIFNEWHQAGRQAVVYQIFYRFKGLVTAVNDQGEVSDVGDLAQVTFAKETSLQFILQQVIMKIFPVGKGIIFGKKYGCILDLKLGTGDAPIGTGHGEFAFRVGFHIVFFKNETFRQAMMVWVFIP